MSPSGGRAGTTEVIDRAVTNYLTYFKGTLRERWYKNMVLFFPALHFGTKLGLQQVLPIKEEKNIS